MSERTTQPISIQQLLLNRLETSWIECVILNIHFKVDAYQRGYTFIEASDSTGTITFRVWNKNETEKLKIGTVITAFLQASDDKSFYNLAIINDIPAYNILTKAKISYYLPKAPVSYKSMIEEIMRKINGFQDEELKEVCLSFFNIYGEVLKTFPGGLSVHHNYLGGLLYHIYSMTKAAEPYSNRGYVNAEMLYTGIILHDIGKFKTFNIDPITRLAANYTTEGSLNDHVAIGISELTLLLSKIKIEQKKAMQLLHIVASHHGEYSIVKPKTLEADLISKLDLIDSREDIYVREYNKLSPDSISDNIYYLKNRIYRP